MKRRKRGKEKGETLENGERKIERKRNTGKEREAQSGFLGLI